MPVGILKRHVLLLLRHFLRERGLLAGWLLCLVLILPQPFFVLLGIRRFKHRVLLRLELNPGLLSRIDFLVVHLRRMLCGLLHGLLRILYLHDWLYALDLGGRLGGGGRLQQRLLLGRAQREIGCLYVGRLCEKGHFVVCVLWLGAWICELDLRVGLLQRRGRLAAQLHVSFHVPELVLLRFHDLVRARLLPVHLLQGVVEHIGLRWVQVFIGSVALVPVCDFLLVAVALLLQLDANPRMFDELLLIVLGNLEDVVLDGPVLLVQPLLRRGFA